jgi:indolepyruvate ferredoxin oxidoreductase, beta subunit
MGNDGLLKDPYNIIVTGVGGQGGVMGSRVLSGMLARKGFLINIGETFGSSQRGGSVMSHIRVSKTDTWSPQIPLGKADLILGLEPVEAIRVLRSYGNPQVTILINTRPIYPVGVISGELEYPSLEKMKAAVKELTAAARFIDATDEAVKLGNPVMGNIVMIGAVTALGVLPVDREEFRQAILESPQASKLDINLRAFDIGAALVA